MQKKSKLIPVYDGGHFRAEFKTLQYNYCEHFVLINYNNDYYPISTVCASLYPVVFVVVFSLKMLPNPSEEPEAAR